MRTDCAEHPLIVRLVLEELEKLGVIPPQHYAGSNINRMESNITLQSNTVNLDVWDTM